jgi:putative glutamine amidotransferase
VTRAPVVGIVGHRYAVSRPHVVLDVTGTPHAYADRVATAGGRPVVLPAGRAVDLLDLVDALVLTGGGDVDARLYRGDPATALDVDRARDDDEVALVRAAAAVGVPLLGVCRGLQVMTVAFGGTLTGHLGDAHRLPGSGHRVRSVPGSLTASILGREVATTSLHHQAVDDPGPSWRVTARAEDGVAEAVEWTGPGSWDALGVQWHPEIPDDATGERLFGWLVGAAGPKFSWAKHRRTGPETAAGDDREHAVARTHDPA